MPAPLPSELDLRQILQGVYDEANGRLRTSAEATIVNADIDISLDPTEDGVYIADNTSGNKLKVEADGSINVNPPGAYNKGNSTSVTQRVVLANDNPTINTNVVNDYVTLLDDTSPNLYVGIAVVGVSGATTGWKIKRVNTSGANTTVSWADASINFDKVWNDRATYNYSV